MANVDRSYVLSLLAQTKTGEDGRLAFYCTQPYPAMRIIAEDRVLSLQLLIQAVEDGLLEQLLVEQAERDAEAKRVAGMTPSARDAERAMLIDQFDAALAAGKALDEEEALGAESEAGR